MANDNNNILPEISNAEALQLLADERRQLIVRRELAKQAARRAARELEQVTERLRQVEEGIEILYDAENPPTR